MKPPCETCKETCCHFIPMQRHEIEALNKVRPRKIPKHKIASLGGELYLIKGTCPWLSKDKRCSAYEARPQICRLIGTKERPCSQMKGFDEEGLKERMDKLMELRNGFRNTTGRR